MVEVEVVVAAAAAVVVVRGRSLLLEHTPSAPTTPNTKGKRLGQRACIGRVAQGQCGGSMRVMGVFEKIGRESVCA